MTQKRTRKGFTIIELLIVVIVIGILAAAGLAKYQNFAETSRRKSCLGQLKTIETGLAVWETSNTAFAENSKAAWGFTPRTGRLTDTNAIAGAANILAPSTAGVIPAIADLRPTVGGPPAFYNSPSSGPLGSVIRDDNVWICPSAISRYYNGEIQNVPDDYMDTSGGGVGAIAHGGTPIGLGGRYLGVVTGVVPLNGGFPTGWIAGTATAVNVVNPSPCPQSPLKLAICGSYGTFGPSPGATTPGSAAFNQGGPVGPDGSTLSRHSSRW